MADLTRRADPDAVLSTPASWERWIDSLMTWGPYVMLALSLVVAQFGDVDSGDRAATELVAVEVAEHTGLAPAQAQLQLQELVDAIISAASADGFLVFDPGHRFWSALSFDESRDVIAALARLGFQFEPSEGWHAGRAPSPIDVSMALAYAGLDSRNMRDLSMGLVQAFPAEKGRIEAAQFIVEGQEMTQFEGRK